MPIFDDAALRRQAQQAQAADPADQVSSAPPGKVGWGAYSAMIGGNAADAFTTLSALTSGKGVEGNPVMRGMTIGQIMAMKAGGTAAIGLIMHEMEKRGHSTAAKAMGYGVGIGMGVLAANNLRVTR